MPQDVHPGVEDADHIHPIIVASIRDQLSAYAQLPVTGMALANVLTAPGIAQDLVEGCWMYRLA